MRSILQATPEREHKVRLTYSDGRSIIIDFTPVIAQGGIFEALSDPQVFAQVKVGEGGRFIEWPGEIDFCADALWLEAEREVGIAA